MTKRFLMILVLSFLLSGNANAQCINTILGTFCPPPGGTILLDWKGTPLCALGGCTKDSLNRNVCSSEMLGYAIKDRFSAIGEIKCTGSCVKPTEGLCQKM